MACCAQAGSIINCGVSCGRKIVVFKGSLNPRFGGIKQAANAAGNFRGCLFHSPLFDPCFCCVKRLVLV